MVMPRLYLFDSRGVATTDIVVCSQSSVIAAKYEAAKGIAAAIGIKPIPE